MTRDEALGELGRLARARVLGWHVGSDRLVRAALDALLADVDTPSLPLLAGLGRREEHEAQELFDRVVEELDLGFEPPSDPTAARWALARWLAGQVVDGSLDPATGVDLIWAEVAVELDYPEELRSVVACAVALADWDESWGVPLERLRQDALLAARELVERLGTASVPDRPPVPGPVRTDPAPPGVPRPTAKDDFRRSGPLLEAGLRDLVNEWDLIGVYDPEVNRDEYDCLIGPLLSRLWRGCSAAEVGEFLRHEVADHFGLDPVAAGTDGFAARVVAWYRALPPEVRPGTAGSATD